MTPQDAYRSLEADARGFVHGLDFLLAAEMSAQDLENHIDFAGGIEVQWGQYPWTDRGDRLPSHLGPLRGMRGYPKKIKLESQ